MNEINTSMNIETPIFKKFKQYMIDKSKFAPNVFNAVPKNLAVFPTITMIEKSNIQNIRATTLDRSQTAYDVTFTIEIYTKDMVFDGVKVPSKEIMNELKYLIFDFFEAWGFIRTQCSDADYLNYEVNRFVIVETGSVNNWNRKLSK